VIGKLGPRTMIAGGLMVMTGGVLLLAGNAGGGSYAANVLPGFLLIGAGVGPMFVAIAIAAMSRVPEDKASLASGLMMTGHEIGAALGVGALTAVAGNLTTRSGLITGYANAFHATAAALAALFLLTLLAVPNNKPQHSGHGHGHMNLDQSQPTNFRGERHARGVSSQGTVGRHPRPAARHDRRQRADPMAGRRRGRVR
jgi:MFS family permease